MNSSKKVFIGVENLRKEIFAAAILAGIILTGARSQSVQAEVLSTDSNNVTEVETSKVANNKQLTPNISMSKENQTHDSSSMVSTGETSDVNEVQENKSETTSDDTSNLRVQLTSLYVDLQPKQMALKTVAATNDTQSILVSTKSTKQQAKKILDDKKKDLDTAKRNLDKTNKALANTQIKVTVNQEVAKNAQKELDSLNTDLTAKQADYDKADKALNDAKVNYQVKKAILASTKEDKSKLKKELANAEEKAKAQAQAKAEHTYFAQTANGKVVDEKGHIMVGYTVKGNQVFDAQSKLVGTLTQTSTTRRMANTVKQENAKVLPQTGDKQNNNTTVGAILVGLGSLLGLGALDKRKED